jgi:hypothetical protein
MNCQMAREAIDSNLRSASVGADAQIHLAQCEECAGYVRLLSLIQSHPRVEAPADFEFRLKAGIARARDERHGTFDQLIAFWKRGFSPSKALATLAVVAASFAGGALYLTRVGHDVNTPRLASIPGVSTPIASPQIEHNQNASTTPLIPKSEAGPSKITTTRDSRLRPLTNLASAVRSSSEQRIVPVLYSKSDQMAAQEVLLYRPGQSRSIIIPRRGQSLGAELAGLQTEKPSKSANAQSVEIF